MANTYSSTSAIRPTVTGTKTANSITAPYTSTSPLQGNTAATSKTTSTALRTPMTGSTSTARTTSTAYAPNATATAAYKAPNTAATSTSSATNQKTTSPVAAAPAATAQATPYAAKNPALTPANSTVQPAATNTSSSAYNQYLANRPDPMSNSGYVLPDFDRSLLENYDLYYTPAEEEAPAVAPNAVSMEFADKARQYLDTYNTDREQKIRDMYSGNIAAQNAAQKTAYDTSANALKTAYDTNLNNLRTAYDNNTASLRTAYDTNLAQIANTYQQNLSDAQAYRDNISPQYQQSMNALGAEYERQRRNNNMQAALNGLNTGAGSQLALGQSMAYQANQGNLARSENEALNEAERGIYNLNRDFRNRQDILNTEYANNLDKLNREYANQQNTYGTTYQNEFAALQTNYQNKIAEAAANNDYQMAAALLDEYSAQYDRTMQQAEQLAQFGDFSMFANIYGLEAAQQMEKNWAFQNPDLAYNLGKITAEGYYEITGTYPLGYYGDYGNVGYSNVANAYLTNSDPTTGANKGTDARTKYLNTMSNYANKTANSMANITEALGNRGNYLSNRSTGINNAYQKNIQQSLKR